ncbi:unnamed protein product [Dovyalis caffra]|uniref:Uncharacterized protein n=1 Tax=Dovyalis caffra TaxID=77055 RepID=A0AAV1STB9_9ROSI|nr:unnamed protein product [Dovyalis caffra]
MAAFAEKQRQQKQKQLIPALAHLNFTWLGKCTTCNLQENKEDAKTCHYSRQLCCIKVTQLRFQEMDYKLAYLSRSHRPKETLHGGAIKEKTSLYPSKKRLKCINAT